MDDDTSSNRFTFQSPIPLVLGDSPNAHITLDEREWPQRERFTFLKPIPVSSDISVSMDELPADNFEACFMEDGKEYSQIEYFFRRCIEKRRFKKLVDFCETEDHEKMVFHLLEQSECRLADNVQLLMLLRKDKYIEAVDFIENLSVRRKRADEELNNIMVACRSMGPPGRQILIDAFIARQDRKGRGLDDRFKNYDHDLWNSNTSLSTVSSVVSGKRHSELVERNEEPPRKRLCFRATIPFRLDDSLAMESGGAVVASEADQGLKEAGTEKDLGVTETAPPLDPSCMRLQDGTEETDKEMVEKKPRRYTKRHKNISPIGTRMRLRSDDKKEEPSISSTTNRRVPKRESVLEVIDEEASSDTPSLPR